MIILTLKQTQSKHEVQRFSNKYNNNYIFEWKRRTTLIVGYEYPDSVNFGLVSLLLFWQDSSLKK